MPLQRGSAEGRSPKRAQMSSATLARTVGSNWTVKEAVGVPARTVMTSNVVWPMQGAPLPEGISEDMGGEDNPFLEGQKQLRDMWRHTPINRYYLAISKLPPLGGPDPRLEFARRPPVCCPDKSVPRADRIVARWHSMPQLRSQLPPEDLEDIVAHEEEAAMRLQVAKAKRSSSRGALSSAEPRCGHRDASGRARDFPHVRCTCCEHPSPKPWMQKKTLGAAEAALIDQALVAER
mmetsp:Transcript_52514/g.150529  ORF Transcript_52514/g.150529 Transcript_52514/m.150529 type:complete len:235 (+) Transcript_52514:180-884(+)